MCAELLSFSCRFICSWLYILWPSCFLCCGFRGTENLSVHSLFYSQNIYSHYRDIYRFYLFLMNVSQNCWYKGKRYSWSCNTCCSKVPGGNQGLCSWKSNYWGGIHLYVQIFQTFQSFSWCSRTTCTNLSFFFKHVNEMVFLGCSCMQTHGVGLLIATEFTNNKSPYELFPAEWGK